MAVNAQGVAEVTERGAQDKLQVVRPSLQHGRAVVRLGQGEGRLDEVGPGGNVAQVQGHGQVRAGPFLRHHGDVAGRDGHGIELLHPARQRKLPQFEVVKPRRARATAEDAVHRNAADGLGGQNGDGAPLPVAGARSEGRNLPPQRRAVHVFQVEVQRVVAVEPAGDILGPAPRLGRDGHGGLLIQLDDVGHAAVLVGGRVVAAGAEVPAALHLAVHLIAQLPRPPAQEAVRVEHVKAPIGDALLLHLGIHGERALDGAALRVRLGRKQHHEQPCHDKPHHWPCLPVGMLTVDC